MFTNLTHSALARYSVGSSTRNNQENSTEKGGKVIEFIATITAIWLTILKTREHFTKYPLKKKNPPEIEK